uniref:Thioredoxin domain-containing protein n=1 Tax=Tetradesmus obliquus TaxID=3088 RepID=A0A383W9Z7_TETOB|eukprot:jgi/Sobl393_1/11660/SZX73516.1
MGVKSRMKSIDFYKKLPTDLTESTLTGSFISIIAATLMGLLLVLELASFMRVQSAMQLVVDSSPQNELLKITFNISFPALSCEFATLDVSDALGKKRMNLTKTIRKTPVDINLESAGTTYVDPGIKQQPKYDDEDKWWDHLDLTQPIHEKYPESTDRRIRFAKIDCTAEVDLCRSNFITAFPSIRVFRRAHDDIYINGQHEHEAYTGDRTKDALVAFADTLVPSAGQPYLKHGDLAAAPKTSGCNLAGFVLVKKVPGTLHFTPRSEHHSFDHNWMNMSHTVNSFYFGAMPSPTKYHALKKLHPLGLNSDWLDKLKGQQFFSTSPQHTHEHYMQVVRTTIQPLHGGKASSYDAYEYNAHSHTYISDHQPTAKFSYDLAAMQVVVREQPRPWYKFLTTTCAVIGGVFTVAGILDSMLYAGINMRKKLELGKQG